MSFIVSFNGQFKNYKLPDLSHYDNVRHVYRSHRAQAVSDNDTNMATDVLKGKDHSHRKSSISSYQKVEKEFHATRQSTLVKDIMSAPVHYAYADQYYEDVLSLMDKYRCRHVPIMNRDEVLVGIVSHTDLLRVGRNLPIEDFMTKEVLTCLEHTRIQEVSKIMLHRKFGALPVINDQHYMIGIVTLSDILYFVTTSNKLDGSA